MPAYSTFFLFILLASVGLPLLNGFIGEFLVLSGAFQAKAWWGVVGATGVIWSACYLLWMYQRVFFGQVKHEENNSLLDLNLRERIALWPAAIMALVMGVAPLLWLNAIDPAVHNVLAAMPQMVAKAVGQ
jgi:NADH-quinone oxidoreductase subunit M